MFRYALMAAVVLGGAGNGWGPTTGTAGGGADTRAAQTVPVEPELPSPKAALQTIYAGLLAGDVATVQACLVFDSEAQRELFELEFTRLWAPLRVVKAVRGKFGKEALKASRIGEVAELETQITTVAAEVEKVEFAFDGDTATVDEKRAANNPNAETALSGVGFRKVKDKWKVVASTFGDMPGDATPELLKMMRGQRDAVAKATSRTMGRLEAGEFKTGDEAWAAYEAALQQAAREGK